MVRAKVVIHEKKETSNGCFEVKAQVVMGGTEENDKFFEATPFGELNIGTLNTEAAAQLVVGQEYYLDLTLASE